MRSLDELVIPAAVVARVTIVGEHADRTWTWRTSYRRVAFARVIDPLKGVVRDQIILLYHDNGNVCPNVRYQRGEELLLFATRVGRGYEAIWWTTGTMSVRGDRVTMHDLFPKGAAYGTIRAQIVQLSDASQRGH